MKRAHLSQPSPPTAAKRAEAMAKVKRVAPQFRWAVARQDAPLIQKITNDLTRQELAALAIVLAEAISSGERLVAICHTTDDGLPEPTLRNHTHAA